MTRFKSWQPCPHVVFVHAAASAHCAGSTDCVVQDLNQGVIAEGKKKMDVLQATKDFKKGIYGLQWEHTRGVMEVCA